MTHPQARTALIIICPPCLRIVSNEVITLFERKFANMYPPECATVIRTGWMPIVPPPKREELAAISKASAEKQVPKTLTKTSTRKKAAQRVCLQSDLFIASQRKQEDELRALEQELDNLTRDLTD
jgi:hypothetical protein